MALADIDEPIIFPGQLTVEDFLDLNAEPAPDPTALED